MTVRIRLEGQSNGVWGGANGLIRQEEAMMHEHLSYDSKSQLWQELSINNNTGAAGSQGRTPLLIGTCLICILVKPTARWVARTEPAWALISSAH